MRYSPRPKVLSFGPGETVRTYRGANHFVDTARLAPPTLQTVTWSGETPENETAPAPQAEPATPEI